MPCKREVWSEERSWNKPSQHNRQDQTDDTEDGRLANADAGPDLVHPQSHDQCQRNRHADGECSPRAIGKRIDDGKPESGFRDNHHKQNGDCSGKTRKSTDLLPRDLCQGFAALANRCEQDYKILNGPSQYHTQHKPNQARQKSELGRQDWPYQWACACDSGEMVAEQHPLAHGIVILTVIIGVRRSFPRLVDPQDLGCKEFAVVAIADRQYRKGK